MGTYPRWAGGSQGGSKAKGARRPRQSAAGQAWGWDQGSLGASVPPRGAASARLLAPCSAVAGCWGWLGRGRRCLGWWSCCTARCVGCPPRAGSFLLSLGPVLCILWMQISEHPAELSTRPRGGGTAPRARSPLGFCSSPCAAPRWQELLRASDSSALRGIHLPASLPRSPTRSQ